MPKSTLRKNLKLKPSQLVKKRKQQFIFKIGLYSVFCISLIIGISSLSAASFMTIDETQVKGLGFLKESQITEIVSEKTQGRLLWLFPKTNIFLYPKEEIKTEILKKYKRVNEAQVSLKDFSDLDISITERKPFALWCKEIEVKSENYEETEREFQKREECFFLDENGFIFDEVLDSDLDNVSNLAKHFGSLTKAGEIGSSFLGHAKFKNLYNFLGLVSSTFEIKPKIIRKQESTLEIFLDFGSVLKISADDDFEKTFENLITLLSDSEFQKVNNPLSLFEYIDLRFGQKVFYKLR